MEKKNQEALEFKKCSKCGRLAFIPITESFCFDCYADRLIKEVLDNSQKKKNKEDKMAKMGICKECGREVKIYAKGLCSRCYKEKKQKENGFDSDNKKNGNSTKAMEVILDFSEYPELYEALKKEAIKEFRSIPYQILWCIHSYLQCKTGVVKEKREESRFVENQQDFTGDQRELI